MKERIKNHERDIALARAFEHDNETGHVPVKGQVRFTDHSFPWYTGRVKEVIDKRLYSENESRDNGIEIPETWMQTIKNHDSRSETKPNNEGEISNRRNDNNDRNAPIKTSCDTPITK